MDTEEIQKVAQTRFYQNIEVPGFQLRYGDARRKHSRFWNEGKWETFIEPLLPDKRGAFLEIGCNAGLFLKLACDAGFRDVYGLEKPGRAMRQARFYQEHNGCPYKLIKGKVGLRYNVEGLPLADVILISNVHYHLSYEVFANLVDRIRYKCRYCIVVSAGARKKTQRPSHHLFELRGFFRDWQELEVIKDVPREDDPAWRNDMYSVLFQGGLSSRNIKQQFESWVQDKEYDEHTLFNCLIDFFTKVKDGEDFRNEDTALYRYWMKRSPHRAARQLRRNRAMAEDIIENGMKQPMFYSPKDNKCRDGGHRFYCAMALGHENILVRVLQ